MLLLFNSKVPRDEMAPVQSGALMREVKTLLSQQDSCIQPGEALTQSPLLWLSQQRAQLARPWSS